MPMKKKPDHAVALQIGLIGGSKFDRLHLRLIISMGTPAVLSSKSSGLNENNHFSGRLDQFLHWSERFGGYYLT
jgi:hypothetical protein